MVSKSSAPSFRQKEHPVNIFLIRPIRHCFRLAKLCTHVAYCSAYATACMLFTVEYLHDRVPYRAMQLADKSSEQLIDNIQLLWERNRLTMLRALSSNGTVHSFFSNRLCTPTPIRFHQLAFCTVIKETPTTTLTQLFGKSGHNSDSYFDENTENWYFCDCHVRRSRSSQPHNGFFIQYIFRWNTQDFH